MTPVRTLLVTGTPGAGRTTVAAAAAASAARAGTRTLLLTGDHRAVAALLPLARDDAGPGSAARPVDGVPGLAVARIDPAASFRAGALDLQSRVGALLSLLGAAPLDPEELTELPGAGAFALLRALREAQVLPDPSAPDVAAPAWDLVVVDLPPVRDAVALLALPEQLRRYLRRLLPADRQAARALRPMLAQLAGVPMPTEWAYEAAARADTELAAVQAVIEDPGTSVAVVLEPGPPAGEALRTARTGFALHGHRLVAVVANRLLPTQSADPFLAGLSGNQQAHLKALAEQCRADAVPLLELPHLGGEPRTPRTTWRPAIGQRLAAGPRRRAGRAAVDGGGPARRGRLLPVDAPAARRHPGRPRPGAARRRTRRGRGRVPADRAAAVRAAPLRRRGRRAARRRAAGALRARPGAVAALSRSSSAAFG